MQRFLLCVDPVPPARGVCRSPVRAVTVRSRCGFPREDRGRSPQRDFHILFVPRRSLLCEQWLKEQGVLGSFIHREQYSLDLIPFDGDLLSMESESAFKVGTHPVLEGKRDVVLCWMLVQQPSEGL